ncbi:MAG: hypothetical protein IKA33_02905, partial [Candidatus Methanomethylophilaceae archaeon]|nr:hypothetical protein [Candidatus Methanomethylophilaceae archaeon]
MGTPFSYEVGKTYWVDIRSAMDGNDGYDKTDLESILEYASRLTGRTMREFLGDPEDDVIGGVSSKGTF